MCDVESLRHSTSLPRGVLVAQAGASPDFGPRRAFPDRVQWRGVERAAPVTVAGPCRILTGFRSPPACDASVVVGELSDRHPVAPGRPSAAP
jgi:hypothetical protein